MLVCVLYLNDAVFGEDCNKKTHFVTIMRYYYVSNKNGKQDGPYDESTLFFLIKNHTFSPDCYIWCEGMPGWLPFRQVFPPRSQAHKSSPRSSYMPPVTVTAKKGGMGIYLGIIIPVVLALTALVCWFAFSNPISTPEELYAHISEKCPQYCTRYYENHKDDFKDEVDGGFQKMYVAWRFAVICNSGDAAEYLLSCKEYSEEELQYSLKKAVERGADQVAAVLAEHGVTLNNPEWGDWIMVAIHHYEKRFEQRDHGYTDKYYATRNFRKCAEILLSNPNCKSEPDKKRLARKISKLEKHDKEFAAFLKQELL